MEILTHKEHHHFLTFLPAIKHFAEEWQLVTIRLKAKEADAFSIQNAATLLQDIFNEKDGRIFICNDYELIMVVREGREASPHEMAKRIDEKLPKGRCEVEIEKPTTEKLGRFKILINLDDVEQLSAFALKRRSRSENIILVADDDMYMRTLIRKGVNPQYTVNEVIHGSEIVSAYKKYTPDILFLDIHMPGKDGHENLEAILAFDPQAYVIMLSSDSSRENVVSATELGAKGFLAKPFDKNMLQALIGKCPTIT